MSGLYGVTDMIRQEGIKLNLEKILTLLHNGTAHKLPVGKQGVQLGRRAYITVEGYSRIPFFGNEGSALVFNYDNRMQTLCLYIQDKNIEQRMIVSGYGSLT